MNRQYRQPAEKIQQFIRSRLWDGQHLKRALAAGRYLGDATLEDYAYVSLGMLEWADYTGKAADMDLVGDIIEQAWKRFYNEQGWQLSEDMIAGIASREAVVADGPMPSASATLVRVTLAYARKTANQELQTLARLALNRGHAALKTDNFWYASHIWAMQEAVAR